MTSEFQKILLQELFSQTIVAEKSFIEVANIQMDLDQIINLLDHKMLDYNVRFWRCISQNEDVGT